MGTCWQASCMVYEQAMGASIELTRIALHVIKVVMWLHPYI